MKNYLGNLGNYFNNIIRDNFNIDYRASRIKFKQKRRSQITKSLETEIEDQRVDRAIYNTYINAP